MAVKLTQDWNGHEAGAVLELPEKDERALTLGRAAVYCDPPERPDGADDVDLDEMFEGVPEDETTTDVDWETVEMLTLPKELLRDRVIALGGDAPHPNTGATKLVELIKALSGITDETGATDDPGETGATSETEGSEGSEESDETEETGATEGAN